MSNASVATFLFFKQKTAYEMRISDWSSDVCSSDLSAQDDEQRGHHEHHHHHGHFRGLAADRFAGACHPLVGEIGREFLERGAKLGALKQALDRKSTRLNSSH